jgi:hypothetical protein
MELPLSAPVTVALLFRSLACIVYSSGLRVSIVVFGVGVLVLF